VRWEKKVYFIAYFVGNIYAKIIVIEPYVSRL